MKKFNCFYKNWKIFGLLILIFFASCKKDELVSKDLLLYMQGDYGVANNTLNVPLTWTPTSVWGKKTYSVAVRATHEVPANIDVYISPDSGFVKTFNQANATNYQILPSYAYKFLNGNKHTIKAGSLLSDSLLIQINDTISSLTDTRGYILPLAVTKYESDDKGPQIKVGERQVLQDR